MKIFAITLSAATMLGALCASAAPGDWPPIKPGYWEISTVMFSDWQHPWISQYCIDEKTTGIIKRVIDGELNLDCGKRKETIIGHSVTVDAVCSFRKVEARVHAVADFPTDTSFRSSWTVHYPSLKVPDPHTPNNGKWTGACPKYFRPGDAVMASGAAVHFGPDGRMHPINHR